MLAKFVAFSSSLAVLWACVAAPPDSAPGPISRLETAATPIPGEGSDSRTGTAADGPTMPARSNARIGDRIIVRLAGERFVPMHRRPAPSFFHGVHKEATGRVIERLDDGRWVRPRLSNGVERWVKAEYVGFDPGKRALGVTDREPASTSGVTRVSDPLPSAGAAPRVGLDLGPMIGHTSSTSARIWIKTSADAGVAVLIGERSDLGDGRIVVGPRIGAGTGFTGITDIDGLSPARRYYYVVLLDGEPTRPPPYASFTTAPPAGQRGTLRFAFSSCVGTPARAAPGWLDLSNVAFDLMLQLGDNHYANSTNPGVVRATYRAHRSLAGFRALTARVATLGIWDDHDFAADNSDGTARGKQRSLATFKEFWPNPAYGQPDDDGIYFKFSRGDIDFFMLDGRYHRSPKGSRDSGRKTMLGAAQLAWLKRELQNSDARIKFIASGTEWQTYGTSDSWRGYRRERNELFRLTV